MSEQRGNHFLFADGSETSEEAVSLLMEKGIDFIELREGINATIDEGYKAPVLITSFGGTFEGVGRIKLFADHEKGFMEFNKPLAI